MYKIVVATPSDDPVGWTELDGEREGEFYIDPDGNVIYRPTPDPREFLAGLNFDQFLSAAKSWNQYQEYAGGHSESEENAVVEELRSQLTRLGVLSNPSMLWSVLFEQVEHGML